MNTPASSLPGLLRFNERVQQTAAGQQLSPEVPVTRPATSATLVDGPESADWTFLFAHGAGAGMASAFMTQVAERMAAGGVRVVRFEFPYMQVRRATGGRRPPNPMPVLQAAFEAMIAEQRAQGVKKLAIGGKSMGGRVASMLAATMSGAGTPAAGSPAAGSPGAAALVCFGYPFHPAGNPEKLRVDHLGSIDCPTLIVQGERDTLGNVSEVAGYDLDEKIRVDWLPDGDHSFKPRKASGFTALGHWHSAADRAVAFLADNAHRAL